MVAFRFYKGIFSCYISVWRCRNDFMADNCSDGVIAHIYDTRNTHTITHNRTIAHSYTLNSFALLEQLTHTPRHASNGTNWQFQSVSYYALIRCGLRLMCYPFHVFLRAHNSYTVYLSHINYSRDWLRSYRMEIIDWYSSSVAFAT